MDKASVIESLRKQLRTMHSRAVEAVEDAAAGATGDDAKAESKYDTRGLESSYLAAGQAEQAEELARIIGVIERFEFRDFSGTDTPIDVGALVAIEFEGDRDWYLLAPGGGGLECESKDGGTATVLAPGAPLAQRILEKTEGTVVENSTMKIDEVH